jgi:pimeloyl-ACP methyl ester carboxylesterase
MTAIFRRYVTSLAVCGLLAFAAVSGHSEAVDGVFVTSDGVRIHYLTAGRGTPVILVHGLGGDARTAWFRTPVGNALAARHRVIAIDLRGHGQSDKPHESSKYGERLWQDVVELMDHLAIARAHFHGYSLGAAVVWSVFVHNPQRVITVAMGGGGVREVDPRWIATLPPDEDERAKSKERDDPDEAAARRQLLALPDRDETALQAVLSSLPRRDEIDLTTVRTPVLVIAAEYDQPIRKTQRPKRELQHFTGVILPGKTHLTAAFPGYMPDLYVRSLVTFVDANDQ